MWALKTPRLFAVERPEPQAVQPSIDEVSQSCTGVFDQLGIGRASRPLCIVDPTGDPIPFPGRVSVVEPDVQDRSSRADFLEPRKDTGLTILVRFDFHDHRMFPRLIHTDVHSSAVRRQETRRARRMIHQALRFSLRAIGYMPLALRSCLSTCLPCRGCVHRHRRPALSSLPGFQ